MCKLLIVISVNCMCTVHVLRRGSFKFFWYTLHSAVINVYHFVPIQFTVREAAKVAGIWDTAPCIHEITSEQWKAFSDAVSICKYLCCEAYEMQMYQVISRFE